MITWFDLLPLPKDFLVLCVNQFKLRSRRSRRLQIEVHVPLDVKEGQDIVNFIISAAFKRTDEENLPNYFRQ